MSNEQENGEGEEQWVTIEKASKEIGIAHNTLSQHIKRRGIETRKDKFDKRVKLVNLTELKRLFETEIHRHRRIE